MKGNVLVGEEPSNIRVMRAYQFAVWRHVSDSVENHWIWLLVAVNANIVNYDIIQAHVTNARRALTDQPMSLEGLWIAAARVHNL